MKPKTQAFLFNFLAFGLIFITIRLIVNYLFPELSRLLASLIAGVTAIFLAPRFMAVTKEDKEVVLMKWIFIKGIKEL